MIGLPLQRMRPKKGFSRIYRLSEFGKEVIRKCNDLGIMIDISHAGDQTVKDILQISNKPLLLLIHRYTIYVLITGI